MSSEPVNFWQNEHTVHHDYTYSPAIARFVAESTDDVVAVEHSMTVHSSTLEVANAVKEFVLAEGGVTARLRSDNSNWLAIDGGTKFIGIVSPDTRSRYQPASDFEEQKSGELFKTTVQVFNLTLVGPPDLLQRILPKVIDRFEDNKYATFKWWYDSPQGATYRIMYLDNPNTTLFTEFYPTLAESCGRKNIDPEEFISEYLKSDSSVLLMAGTAGTGKTTLLRHMVYKHNLNASVVYDEKLMQNDQVFQSFLFDKENDVLIIEDADTIITSRQDDNNKLMARFLNISDGLIKLPNKKLIFTTNINDFSRVDSALVRPGRCFAVAHTRHLTFEEAQTAAAAAKLPLPLEEREYTLAELFTQKKWQEKRRIGFGFA